MASSSKTMDSQGDDDTFVEETPQVNIDSDSESGGEDTSDKVHKEAPSGKRKRATKVKKTVKKEPKEGKERAHCWKYFNKVYKVDDDGVRKKFGICKFCETELRADPNKNGTSSLRKHYPTCEMNPEFAPKKNQSNLVFKKEANGEASVSTWKHDEGRIKKALLNLFVVAELPFKLVENEAFVEYTNSLNAKFSLPSRHKLSKDIGKYYLEERNKLLAYLSKPTNTVHLTTDTWTSSCQRVNYMVVTAHFIDDDWVMHKRIINFRPINSHKGDDIGRELYECIHGWGIKNVMTMTVDNASSNDKAIECLLKKLDNLYDDGKHFHVRCMAHILNLIVKDGLSETNNHVQCVQKAVRYIRNSTQRIAKFKKCMKECNVEAKRFLCGDCPTRWNSTYEMLKVAVDLREVFFAYELEDENFIRDLDRLPGHSDFGFCQQLVEFLEIFKYKTEFVSASSKPLSHLFFREILDVNQHLREWEAKPQYRLMAKSMREKYNKYWGKFDELNDFMYFSVMLDPTVKSSFIAHCFKKMIMYDITKENPMSKQLIDKKVASMVEEVENRLEELFKRYKERFDNVEYNSASQEACNEEDIVKVDGCNKFFTEFLHVEGSNSVAIDTELKRYLKEPKVNLTTGFDILRWWKQNAIRYPIVSRMARDILAIQISTVASESAFSTGGRVLDSYRTNLSTSIVEALVCTQDWVRKSRKPIVDDIDDILRDDDIAKEIEDAINEQNAKEKGKGKKSIDG